MHLIIFNMKGWNGWMGAMFQSSHPNRGGRETRSIHPGWLGTDLLATSVGPICACEISLISLQLRAGWGQPGDHCGTTDSCD